MAAPFHGLGAGLHGSCCCARFHAGSPLLLLQICSHNSGLIPDMSTKTVSDSIARPKAIALARCFEFARRSIDHSVEMSGGILNIEVLVLSGPAFC
jgi:hypothetical protein